MLRTTDDYHEDAFNRDQDFINTLLGRFSLEAPFPFSVVSKPSGGSFETLPSTQKIEIKRAVAILQTLLQSKQREQSFRTDTEERIRRLNEELELRQSAIVPTPKRLQSL